MKVTAADVRRVAELAYLELTEDEVVHFVADLNSILDDIHRLDELDTTGGEPMAQLALSPAADLLREDRVSPGLTREDALRNAPDTDGVHFRVPKVIDR